MLGPLLLLLLLASLGLGLLPGSISERPGEGAAEAGGGKGGRGGPGGWARSGGGEAALPQATAGERQAAFVRGLRLLFFSRGRVCPEREEKQIPARFNQHQAQQQQREGRSPLLRAALPPPVVALLSVAPQGRARWPRP